MTMNWHELALNPEALENLYETVPPLDRIRVFSLRLGDRGELCLRLDLPVFPDRPPRRWPREANTAQLVLTFWEVRNYTGRGWTNGGRAALGITRADGSLRVALDGIDEDFRHDFAAGFFRIDGVEAYRNDEGADNR
ncbi:MAG: hypothetical protein JSS81_16135 [Acidobacteria bacterium]|nr:hypothetical protein [Acidobacteriota bacterium]